MAAMDTLERLQVIFQKFPGIGPRQAQRFVQYLLRTSPAVRRELIEAIQGLGGSVRRCTECMRFHTGSARVCDICGNPKRDTQLLAVVATDADLAALEKSSTYYGKYFVLGGTLHLGSETTSNLHIADLLASLATRVKDGLEEIILAFPANPEGDATAARINDEIRTKEPSLKVTALGRGLSTGSELEYADPETIKSALEGRK